MKNISVLITGAGGYIGSETVIDLCSKNKDQITKIVATDIVQMPESLKGLDIVYEQADIRDEQKINDLIFNFKINTVVHLAAALPSRDGKREEFEYSVNVLGTKNILEACIKNGVSKIIVSSSGAAYGYHSDNSSYVDEHHPLRGNAEFPYCKQKKEIEQMLLVYRQNYPELKQLVFRLSATIGANVNNQISEFLELPVLFGIYGYDTPFVFIWDKDVVNCLVMGITSNKSGVFNLAGDGKIPMKELAMIMKKPYFPVSEKLFYYSIKILQKLKMVPWGPEQTSFIKHRLVLSNEKLKSEFGYVPLKNSNEVFDYYLGQRGKIPQ